MEKLNRIPRLSLATMQDLGGCRAVLSSVEAVDRIAAMYLGEKKPHEIEGEIRFKDYIRGPKPDGYRGIHIIGQYRPGSAKYEPWRGQLVEVQLRSRLQHAFATAVETVTTFLDQPLKFGGGVESWRRFFALMGSALALREGTNPVPSTPADRKEMIAELAELAQSLNVAARLAGWTSALNVRRPRYASKKYKWLLLELYVAEHSFKVTPFEDTSPAVAALAEIERGQKGIDAVLVWADSAKELKRAYPNYYADTRVFVEALIRELVSVQS
jgi:hypothetical protein